MYSHRMSAFDHRAAADGVLTCERALQHLWAALAGFDATRLAAIEEWVGPHRRTYDDLVSLVRGAVDDAHWMVEHARAVIVVADGEARAEAAVVRPLQGAF